MNSPVTDWTTKWPTSDLFAFIPSAMTSFRPHHPQRMATQPTAIWIPVDWKYALVPIIAAQRRMPDGMNGLSIDDSPFGAPGISSQLYEFFKEKNQKVSHFMIGANIRDRA